jgi:SP family arabinose:H+ symporter-like MFS transporter
MTVKIHLKYLIFLGVTAALGGLLFGFDIAIITGAGPFLVQQFHLNDLSLGWAFSSLLFGCVVGAVIAGRIADSIGRKKVLLGVAVLFAVTSVATGMAGSFTAFIVARFLGGLAVGGASLLSPMYVSEVSPPTVRGRMGTLYQMSIVTGILVSYCINYGLRNIGPDNWRWMFATGVIPSVIFFTLLLLAPETPRYLLKVGKESQARNILERIGGGDVNDEMEKIRFSFAEKKSNWPELLQPGIKRAVTVSIFLAILIHVSGVNTVIDYAPRIFQAAGWNIDLALLSTFAVGLTNFTFTIVSFWIIDRFGRKPVYIVGSLGMSAALCVLVVLAALGRFQGMMVMVPILVYLTFFCSCIGPVFWTLVPEIFPNHIRGTAMTVPVLIQWVANAMVVLLFPVAFNRMGKVPTFGFLAAMCLAQAIFTWIYVPETKNKTLEEIEEFWLAEAKDAPVEELAAK